MVIVAPDPLSLYCDGSVSKDRRYITVAGAIASVENWRAFDSEWQTALADNHLKYFRMSEFAHSVGQFEIGWKGKETKRRALIERLAKIIIGRVRCWVGACVPQKEYDAADRIYRLHEYLYPYPLCGLTCVEMARRWQKLHQLDYLPMEYVCEEGDEHSDQLWKQVRKDFGQYPIFRKKLGEVTKPEDLSTPLQVGDFAAYELGKFFGTVDPDVDKLFEDFRKSFLFLGLSNIDNHWGELQELGIRTELNLRNVPKR